MPGVTKAVTKIGALAWLALRAVVALLAFAPARLLKLTLAVTICVLVIVYCAVMTADDAAMKELGL
jgi:hypothetical protein